ncbi:MAG: multicopper oxidase domain-containing protein [Oscillospiraceae bacterium]
MWNLSDYPDTGQIREYDIEAISLPIVYNQYGDHDPNGLLYVLREDSQRIRKEALRNFRQPIPQPYEGVQPLVIRANLGDTVRIRFFNQLGRRASIHVQGLSNSVLTSDGANVGFNPDTTTDDSICYTWLADKEGAFLFSDLADPRSSEEGANVHGLFGAILVEPAGSVWLHPETGKPLRSGLFADICSPGRPAFREYAVFFHDELEIRTRDGGQPETLTPGFPAVPPPSATAPSRCATVSPWTRMQVTQIQRRIFP